MCGEGLHVAVPTRTRAHRRAGDRGGGGAHCRGGPVSWVHTVVGLSAMLCACEGGVGGDALKRGGEEPRLPSRAPSLCPATVPLTASASLNGIGNRQ